MSPEAAFHATALPRSGAFFVDAPRQGGGLNTNTKSKNLIIMAYQQKEGQGSLFINEKTSNNNQPDYKGSILIDGKLYDLAAWHTVAKTGREYISLKAELHVEGKWAPREQVPPRSIAPKPAAEQMPADTMFRDEDYFAPEDPNNPDLPF